MHLHDWQLIKLSTNWIWSKKYLNFYNLIWVLISKFGVKEHNYQFVDKKIYLNSRGAASKMVYFSCLGNGIVVHLNYSNSINTYSFCGFYYACLTISKISTRIIVLIKLFPNGRATSLCQTHCLLTETNPCRLVYHVVEMWGSNGWTCSTVFWLIVNEYLRCQQGLKTSAIQVWMSSAGNWSHENEIQSYLVIWEPMHTFANFAYEYLTMYWGSTRIYDLI